MNLGLNEKAYVDQLFGENSYFQDGFTYLLSLFFIITGIAYGIGAKTIKSDKDLVNKTGEGLSSLGTILLMIFFASQFISILKETNIPTIIVVSLTNFLKMLPLSGLALVLVAIVIIAVCNIFMPSSMSKWVIISPVLVPMLMQLNISPQFSQFIFRASESMTNGITPVLAYFVVYVGYLNIYNKDKNKTYGIRDGIKLMMPYFTWMSLVWILIIVAWYLIGLPLGPSVYPTL